MLLVGVLLGGLTIPIYSDAYIIDGQHAILNARAFFSQVIHPTGDPPYTVTLYQFNTYSNSVTRQIIAPYRLEVYPEPNNQQSYRDRFGNQVTQLTYNRSVEHIRVESNFMFSTEMNSFVMDSQYVFPLDSASIRMLEDYVVPTDFCQTGFQPLINRARNLSQGLRLEYLVVLNVFNWIRSHIKYVPTAPFSDARRTLMNGYGNKRGMLNLSITLLRINRIPARYVHGLAMDRTLYFPVKEEDVLEIRYPKSLYEWVEVYFPDRDWCSFDIFTSFFLIPPYLIRKSVGLDHRSCADQVQDESGYFLPLHNQFSVEVRRERTELQLNELWEDVPGIVFLPPMPTSIEPVVHDLLTAYPKSSSYYSGWLSRDGISFEPFSMQFDSNFEHLEVRVTPDSLYTQGFILNQTRTIQQVELPLYRFNNELTGNIWVEILEDYQGKPGRRVARSKNVSMQNLIFQPHYSWVSFPFTEPVRLEDGAYWLVFHYDSREIILWYGIYGNPFQRDLDTLYVSPDSLNWNAAAFFDFCFRFHSY
jgi:transglutaminase-like putative cysteine protease